MAVELDHSFTTSRSLDDSYATILDLERVVPCVEGATVLERTGPDSVRAEIKVKALPRARKLAFFEALA